jgi:hypothetical protein
MKQFAFLFAFLFAFNMNAQPSYPAHPNHSGSYVPQVFSPAPYTQDTTPERPTIGSSLVDVLEWGELQQDFRLLEDTKYVTYEYADETIRINWYLIDGEVEYMLWSFSNEAKDQVQGTLQYLKGEFCMVSEEGNIFTCENRLGYPTLVEYIKDERMFFFMKLPKTTKG